MNIVSTPFRRALSSLLLVLATCAAYSWVVVPLIEPQIRWPEPSRPATVTTLDGEPLESQLSELRSLFAGAAWELDTRRTKILDTEYGKLLFWDYQPLSDGTVEVKPLTVIYDAGETEKRLGGKAASQEKRAVVLQAPEGAVLKFDRPMHLGQTDIGRLLGGRLRGEIRVFSRSPSTEAADELEIVTRNIQIGPQRAFTPHEVRFRFGQSWGSGRNLVIHLARPEANTLSKPNRLRFEGVRMLELVHVDKVHLQTRGRSLWPRGGTGSDSRQANPPSDDETAAQRTDSAVPLELTCRGPFLFDFKHSIASFEDHVDVLRIRPDGPCDQLNCQLLEIHFASTLEQQGASGGHTWRTTSLGQTNSSFDMQRIVAVGHPVTIHSTYEVEAQRLEYEAHPAEQFGFLWAEGPGRIYTVGGEVGAGFSARWTKELFVQPQDGQHVISLLSDAVVECVGMGGLAADELHVWVKELPRRIAADAHHSAQQQFALEKMLALRNVRIDSPQLSGGANHVEAWFKNQPSRPAQTGHSPLTRKGQFSPSAAIPVAVQQSSNSLQPKIDIHGEQVRLELLQVAQEVRVENATVAGNVRLVETKTQKPDDLPLVITGHVLQLASAAEGDQNTYVEVSGQPASVRARGLMLSGERINLDQHRNRLWIDSPGHMVLPSSPRRFGQEVRSDSGTLVKWNGRMEFDGRKASFERDVTTSSTYRLKNNEQLEMIVTGQKLDVTLARPISFSTANARAEDAQLETLTFANEVFIENHRRTDQNRLIAIDRLQTRNLRVEQPNQRLTADGPGRATSIYLGKSGDERDPGKPGSTGGVQPSRVGFNYAQIDFQNGIYGDLEKHEVHFVGGVRAVHGPVAGWDERLDAERPGGLGDDGVLVTCERLIAAEMGPPVNGERMLEFQALENTYLEGRGFTANAHRMSYDRSKDLFVLEGTARTDAQLRQQERFGGPENRAAARKILFWRNERRIQVDDARFLDLSHFGLPPR